MKSKLFAAFCLIVIALCIDSPTAIMAEVGPSPCVAGRNAAPFGFWTWPAGSQVNIYLREPDFSDADVAAVSVSVRNWDQSAVENGSNVHFKVRGLTLETRTTSGDLTIVRGNVYDSKRRHLAMLQAHSLKEDQLIDYAVVIVDVRVKNREVLTNVMAHELGHSLGLLDCFKCNNKSTVMGLMRAGDESNGIEGPTACDKEVVVAAYRELLTRVARAPLNIPIVDEGEEPEADDTPIVDRP